MMTALAIGLCLLALFSILLAFRVVDLLDRVDALEAKSEPAIPRRLVHFEG